LSCLHPLMDGPDYWNQPDSIIHSLDMTVSDYLLHGAWNLPPYLVAKDKSLGDKICSISLPLVPSQDNLNWNSSVDGSLTFKLAYSLISGAGPTVA
jgi:hypothetical protein